MLFRQGKNSLQSGSAVFNSLPGRESFAIPAEGDDVGNAGLCRGGNELTIDFDEGIVVLPAIEGPLDASQSTLVFRGSRDGTGEAEGSDGGDFAGVEKVDALQSEVRSAFGEILEGEGIETPAADGLGVSHEGRRVKLLVFPPGSEAGEKETDNATAEERQDDEEGERDMYFLSHQVDGDGLPVEGCNDKDHCSSHKEGADTEFPQHRSFALGRGVCDGRQIGFFPTHS